MRIAIVGGGMAGLALAREVGDAPAMAGALGSTGVALLAASIIAGGLWDEIGPRGTFLAGAAFTTLAIVGVMTLRRPSMEQKR